MLTARGKILLVALPINLIVVVFSLFSYHYAVHTGHWTAEAWLYLLVSSSVTKTVLFLATLVNAMEGKLVHKELKDGESGNNC